MKKIALFVGWLATSIFSAVFFVPVAKATTYPSLFNATPLNWSYWGTTGSGFSYSIVFTPTSDMSVCSIGIPISRASGVPTSTTDKIVLHFWETTSTRTGVYNTYPNRVAITDIMLDASSIIQKTQPTNSTTLVNFPICYPLYQNRNYNVVLDAVSPTTTSYRYRIGNNLSLTNPNTRSCYSNATTTQQGCSSSGSGAIQLFGIASSTGYIVPPLPVSTSSLTYVCPDWGLFTPLCDLAIWAVVPDFSSASSTFYRTKASLVSKPPFSYLTQIQTYILTDSSVTGTSPDITISTAGFAPTTTSFGQFVPQTVTLFNASSVKAYFPVTVWGLLRTLFGYTFMAAAITYIYFRVRHIFKYMNN